MLTNTSIGDGLRRIYRGGRSRLRLADGAVLPGVEDSKAETQVLMDEGFHPTIVGFGPISVSMAPIYLSTFSGERPEAWLIVICVS